ncbi:MAG: hypothetical protein OHK93_002487 [Ramalina farinacea]|uniref:TAFII55 protein conserved region domain-containing protein n=1 Tax=Ramalina farinacea TaxID=258253 RepID=A0AA43QRG5_9LECA|nr:hypothetical protein [Ramalina farinacea]
MSEPRPTLKLKFGSLSKHPTGTSAPEAPEPTPPSATTKLKLTFGGANKKPASPSPAPTNNPDLKPPPKPSRKSKPTPKKRAAEAALADSDSDEGEPLATQKRPPIKKLKLTTGSKASPATGVTPTTARTPSSAAPFLKLKSRGRKPHRPLGVGYDSEASDREDDPTITDNFILRMQPGEDCDYLRQAVAERRFGPVKDGGADVRMRFISKEGRRAVIIVRGRMYAAALVDLPCIIEAMKSWEKKAWWKSGDVWQMLLVLGQCDNEEEAMAFPLPRGVDERTWQYAHGLTPPMRWVRKRRFRKRISVRAVEEDEREVERLLRMDEECVPGSSRYRTFDSVEEYDREQSMMHDEEEESEEDDDDEQDAEGDLDALFAPAASGATQGAVADGDVDYADLEAEMEAAMAEQSEEEDAVGAAAASGVTTTQAPTPSGMSTTAKSFDASNATPLSTPASPAIAFLQAQESSPNNTTTPNATSSDAAEESSDEDASDEDASDTAADEDAVEAAHEKERQREEIADLQGAIERKRQELQKTANAILRAKVLKNIESLEADLEVRQRALGEEEGGDAADED